MLVLSDDKDDYSAAEWVAPFVTGLLTKLDPARAAEIAKPFAR